MPETVRSLDAYINDGKNISNGAAADYGLDPYMYALNNKKLTDGCIEDLKKIYKIILSKDGAKEKLHQAVRTKTLIKLLNNEEKGNFDWVVYSGNLF